MDVQSHQFISFFGQEEAKQLCQLAVVENYPDQTVIFEEGEIPDFLYLVIDGQVDFRKKTSLDKYQTVAKALPNDFFGEFGILDGEPRSAQAVARGQATLAKIGRNSLISILDNTKSTVVIQLFRYIIQRLRVTTQEYVKQLVYKEKMVLLGEMVNTVIHDFKSPLSGINLSTSMLKEFHEEDEETTEWCELIQAQAQRMSAMAEQLLEFSKGDTVLKKQPVNLAKLLANFEKLNQLYCQEVNVELVIYSEEIVINADESKLLRVLQNLVVNAVEAFNGKGGRVEITLTQTTEEIEFQIRDNGPGIPEAIREHFFNSFVTYGKQSGTGLGSAIAKSIIDAHEGKICFQSSCPGGTTFYIRLPFG